MKRWLALLMGMFLLLALTATAAEMGKTTTALDAGKVASEETAFGNLLADALRNAAGTDAAIVHAMAFRANALIPVGTVDDTAMRNSLASPSRRIAVLKLTPAQLRGVMQRALTRYPNPNPAFLHVSGLTVTFDSTKPATARVVGIALGGKALDLADAKTQLTVAMPHELALGAVGYLADFTTDVTKSLELAEVTVLDAVAKEFARQNGEIAPAPEGRLVDVNPPKKQ